MNISIFYGIGEFLMFSTILTWSHLFLEVEDQLSRISFRSV